LPIDARASVIVLAAQLEAMRADRVDRKADQDAASLVGSKRKPVGKSFAKCCE
jgi:hypothetical protein